MSLQKGKAYRFGEMIGFVIAHLIILVWIKPTGFIRNWRGKGE